VERRRKGDGRMFEEMWLVEILFSFTSTIHCVSFSSFLFSIRATSKFYDSSFSHYFQFITIHLYLYLSCTTAYSGRYLAPTQPHQCHGFTHGFTRSRVPCFINCFKHQHWNPSWIGAADPGIPASHRSGRFLSLRRRVYGMSGNQAWKRTEAPHSHASCFLQ
jgi:hypothetical protein